MKYLLIICCLVLSSCYTRQRATTQFAKASVAYPELPAAYCAKVYPTKDSIILGKDIINTDTLWGENSITIRDTIRNRDTVWIKIVERLPGQVITRTVLRTDTVFQTNTAAVDLCAIERRNAIALATDKDKEAKKWKAIAKKRFWIILGLGAAMALGIFAMIRKKVVKKVVP